MTRLRKYDKLKIIDVVGVASLLTASVMLILTLLGLFQIEIIRIITNYIPAQIYAGLLIFLTLFGVWRLIVWIK